MNSRGKPLTPFENFKARFEQDIQHSDRADDFTHKIDGAWSDLLWPFHGRDNIVDTEFIGYIGLAVPRFEAAFTPCVEIGWRLASPHWGQGLATEDARAALRHGFEALELLDLVSFTVPANLRSRGVMERLGISHDALEDFDHSLLAEGHLLRRHVLYRLRRLRWTEQVDAAMK